MDLGRSLRQALAKFTGASFVDEKAVKELCREIQRALISADVNVRLVFELTKRIETRALQTKLAEGLSLKEHVVRIVYEELTNMMGESYTPRLSPHKILLLGLYGSGKTTTAGKLAHFYKSRGLSVALVCCDSDRPAAFEQLSQIAKQAGASFFGIQNEKDPKKILQHSMPHWKEDVIIIDSAGRNALDPSLIEQLKEIASIASPDEKFLVVSADIGQVAGKQAAQFHEAVGLSGVIVTKMDGSGKGGGALSAVAASKAKVAFIGTGEKLDAFEPFDAKKFVGRLLGFPDIQTLIEKIKKVTEEEKLASQEAPEKLTLKLFYEQLKAAKKLGPLSDVLSMLGASDMPKEFLQASQDKMKKYEAIISSMTSQEREDASLFRKQKSRILRVAKGSGTSEQDVKDLLDQFEKMSALFNQFKKNRGLRKKMEKMLKGANIDLSKFSGLT
ncbi:MAG: signal recognition particle receptor subunit alpha [Candidatus Micrarchaeota archaeon]|nr:signal recognition particle receptor subunit alpha [Candidatus Micrarchaeota archaeon]